MGEGGRLWKEGLVPGGGKLPSTGWVHPDGWMLFMEKFDGAGGSFWIRVKPSCSQL